MGQGHGCAIRTVGFGMLMGRYLGFLKQTLSGPNGSSRPIICFVFLLECSLLPPLDPMWALEEMSSIRSFVSREEAGYRWQGFVFIVVSFVFLLLFLYAAIISKLLSPSDNAFLSAIQKDW